jgi:hypothetical protein
VGSKEGHVVSRGLDAKNEAALVVHLDRSGAEVVAYTNAVDADREVAADLMVAWLIG